MSAKLKYTVCLISKVRVGLLDSSNAGKGEQGEEVNSNAAGSNPNIQVDALQDEDEDMEKEKIPEPATEEDLANIKKRLVEMGVTRDDGTKLATGLNHSSREGELLDMVCGIA